MISDDECSHQVLPVSDIPTVVNDTTVANSDWNLMIASSFSQYREQHYGMKYPWEQGVMSDSFGGYELTELPSCSGLAELGKSFDVSTAADTTLVEMSLPVDAKFLKVVGATKDMEYFEAESQKLDLACAQWLELLSISWKAFTLQEIGQPRS